MNYVGSPINRPRKALLQAVRGLLIGPKLQSEKMQGQLFKKTGDSLRDFDNFDSTTAKIAEECVWVTPKPVAQVQFLKWTTARIVCGTLDSSGFRKIPPAHPYTTTTNFIVPYRTDTPFAGCYLHRHLSLPWPSCCRHR
jgi:hypothetical protein